ncbi:unnamed protein product [Lymnaea stagnalis]|uniref:Uncharacterized protein n=1 Tax=Lymnaea stagnalis TaxID=6523 RepID=A0AAV2HSI3_LYMST
MADERDEQEEEQPKRNTPNKKSPKKESGKKREDDSRQKKSYPLSATVKGRENKIYRTPATPPPDVQLFKEKSFVLDCNATSSICQDYCRVNPKLGRVIPPYNALRDKHVDNYFKCYGVNRTLRKNNQSSTSSSIEGPAVDRFYEQGPGYSYLSFRNQFGAGHSQETIDGHAQFMSGIRCVTGYNGRFGFRRNTPNLRNRPTPFEPALITPTF